MEESKHPTMRAARPLARRISWLAALALAVSSVSCPKPIDEELLLVAEDSLGPEIVVDSPSQNSLYKISVSVRGRLADPSVVAGDGRGALKSLALTVSDFSLLNRTVSFARDGTFTVAPADPSFRYDPADGSFGFDVATQDLTGMRVLTLRAEDLNGNATEKLITVVEDRNGPWLRLDKPLNMSSYVDFVYIEGFTRNSSTDPSTSNVAKLSWSVPIIPLSGELLLDASTLEPDGITYKVDNFEFDSSTGAFKDRFSATTYSGTLGLVFRAEDQKGNPTEAAATIIDTNTGPAIVLYDASHPPACSTLYSSAVTTALTIHGIVGTSNLEPGSLKYVVDVVTGVPRSAAYPAYDSGTGEFLFTFNPRVAPLLSGRLTVRVSATDLKGKTNEVSNLIYDDPVKPVIGAPFLVAAGATYTASTSVSIGFTVTDDSSGMADMRFSNDGASWSAWEPYAAGPKAWTLASGDGTKSVYAEFSDQVANVQAASDSIELDSTGPVVTGYQVNSGAAATNLATVSISYAATDAGSGISEMRFRDNGTGWTVWQSYSTPKSWTLSAGEESKTVYGEFRDVLLNVTQKTATIVYDTTGPTVTGFAIDAGAAATNQQAVSLTCAATDGGSGVAQMRFSNNGSSWSEWEGYYGTTSWNLSGGEGTKTVYAEFRDAAGNDVQTTDDIEYDATVPTVTGFIVNADAAATNQQTVNLTYTATDSGSGMAQMRFSNNGSSWSVWEAYAGSKTWTMSAGEGSKTVYGEFRDTAGNVRQKTDGITYDTTLPVVATFVINNDAANTSSSSVNLNIDVSDGGSGMSEMHFSNDGSTWSLWEPYATTKSWSLTAGMGPRTVYAQFTDVAGNTQSASDSIDKI
ncbi:MAG: hypothetical protein NT005_02035 [Spirochaetes bacterium]|nr:hypothetical protein [Spirochaetota bacterium]